jgi:hypothetical protein
MTPEQINKKFAQLEEIEQRCNKIERGQKVSFRKFDDDLIENVAWFFPRRGWRLWPRWRSVLYEKYKQYPYTPRKPE